MPVFGTIASQFNDPGLNNLYNFILRKINDKNFKNFSYLTKKIPSYERICIIPQKRIRYLSEISDENRSYNNWVDEQKNIASEIYNLNSTKKILEKENTESELLMKIKKNFVA